MEEFFKIIISFITGVLAAGAGAYFNDRIATSRELKSFYGWVLSILSLLLEVKEKENGVSDSLTTTELHYCYSKLWSVIPETDNGVNVRAEITRFIKGGGNLDELQNDEGMKKLHCWLKKNA